MATISIGAAELRRMKDRLDVIISENRRYKSDIVNELGMITENVIDDEFGLTTTMNTYSEKYSEEMEKCNALSIELNKILIDMLTYVTTSTEKAQDSIKAIDAKLNSTSI